MSFKTWLNENNVKIITSKYSWGKLIVIEVGISFKVIMHPEHQKMIESMKEDDTVSFKDEQGYMWKVTKTSDFYIFKSNRDVAKVSVDKLDKELSK